MQYAIGVEVLRLDLQATPGDGQRVQLPHPEIMAAATPGSVLLLDDERVIHESTPIQPLEDGGHRDTLVVTLRARNGVISVQDQGPGVPDYALAKLGERFFSTVRPDGVSKGSGLGLAIVRQIMALHGGRMDVRNTEPGLCVELRFVRVPRPSGSSFTYRKHPPHYPRQPAWLVSNGRILEHPIPTTQCISAPAHQPRWQTQDGMALCDGR